MTPVHTCGEMMKPHSVILVHADTVPRQWQIRDFENKMVGTDAKFYITLLG